ncbi:MAG: 50S ribosomal protein L30 [Microbacteriaceae bacterium]|nr:50S ribosomal protein L30 [Microbacteriaceae bacterium]MCI1206915.1 50S ribosomal protein L30 [Microbacteriaceae bacterium]
MMSLHITQIKSEIGEKPAQRNTLRSLGLKHVGHTVVKEDSPSVRGYLRAVRHLVTVEEN